jgi:hypothetical protein
LDIVSCPRDSFLMTQPRVHHLGLKDGRTLRAQRAGIEWDAVLRTASRG